MNIDIDDSASDASVGFIRRINDDDSQSNMSSAMSGTNIKRISGGSSNKLGSFYSGRSGRSGSIGGMGGKIIDDYSSMADPDEKYDDEYGSYYDDEDYDAENDENVLKEEDEYQYE